MSFSFAHGVPKWEGCAAYSQVRLSGELWRRCARAALRSAWNEWEVSSGPGNFYPPGEGKMFHVEQKQGAGFRRQGSEMQALRAEDRGELLHVEQLWSVDGGSCGRCDGSGRSLMAIYCANRKGFSARWRWRCDYRDKRVSCKRVSCRRVSCRSCRCRGWGRSSLCEPAP